MLKVILIVLGLVVAAAVIGTMVGLQQLQPMVVQRLSAGLRSDVTAGSVSWTPPLGLEVTELMAYDRNAATPVPWLHIPAALVRVTSWQGLLDSRSAMASPGGASLAQCPPATLTMSRAKVNYVDRSAGSPGVPWQIEGLTANVTVSPQHVAEYTASGFVNDPNGRSVGELRIEGRTAPDQQTEATASLDHRAAGLLGAYFKQAIGAEVKTGEIAIRAKVHGQGDTMSSDVHLEGSRLTFEPGATTTVGVPAQQLIKLLEDPSGKFQLDFTLKGRWDQPQVEWQQLIATAVQQSLKGVVAKAMQEAVPADVAKLVPGVTGTETREELEAKWKALGKDLKVKLKEQLKELVPRESASSPDGASSSSSGNPSASP